MASKNSQKNPSKMMLFSTSKAKKRTMKGKSRNLEEEFRSLSSKGKSFNKWFKVLPKKLIS